MVSFFHMNWSFNVQTVFQYYTYEDLNLEKFNIAILSSCFSQYHKVTHFFFVDTQDILTL